MSESLIERKCSKWAKEQGWLTYKFTSPNNRSVPDRIYIKDGNVVFVEFKAPGKTPTRLQNRTIKSMREHGVTTIVIDNVEAFKNVMS